MPMPMLSPFAEDEISMVDASFLEAVEGLARGIRKRKEAFGGIQARGKCFLRNGKVL